MRALYLLPFALLLTACPKGDGGPSADAPASQPAVTTAPPPPAEPATTPVAAGGACAATAACAPGLVCTTDHGACDRPPGCGPDDMCAAVCYGVCADAEAAAAEPKAVACQVDADCVTHSNYCGGCRCDALPKGDEPDKCPGKLVSCVMDPCRGRAALCKGGRCVAGELER